MQAVELPSRLRSFVRYARVYTAEDNAQLTRIRRLPHSELELLISFGAETTHASVLGVRTRPIEKPVSHGVHALLVRFRAGAAYPFFRAPMSALADTWVGTDDLWSAADQGALQDTVQADEVTAAALGTLLGALERPASREPAGAVEVRRALRYLERAPRIPSVAELAAELGASERSLRRGFENVVGVSPKRHLRIARFRRALSYARGPERSWGVGAPRPLLDWAAIAEQVGYFDQAHMIAEFQALAGSTPGALALNSARRASR